jgi:hypothetical protein|tara:strand:+ start:829 stop:1194 length:366 start_codon:yes stop_codon:yes gene_type:complete
MNLRTIFKAQSIVLFINAIGGLFLTSAFLGAAGWEITPDLITLGQFTGMTFLVFAIWAWRLPDVASDSIKSIGMLFAIGGLLFTIIIAYHIMIGAVAGATAYVNIILTALFAIAFYFYSRD